MKRLVLTAALVAAFACLAPPAAHAQNNPNRNVFRFTAGYLASTSDIKINRPSEEGDTITTNNEWKNGWGGTLSYENRFSPLMGVEVGASYYRPNVKLDFLPFEDRVRFVPVTLGLMFHLGASDSFDLYLGPQAVYVFYGEVNSPVADVNIELKDEFTWGGKAGIDIPFGPNWALSVNAQYIAADAKLDLSDVSYRTRPRPVTINAGVAYRF